MEEPGGLQSVHGVAKSQTRLSNFTFTFQFHALEKEMATHSSVRAWRIPGTGEPGGLQSRGHKEWDLSHDRSDLACMHYASQNTYRIYTHILWQVHAFIKEERII